MKPIFIFSLPRSGSTLLQRILASSPQISTASEPWILLPYLYTLKQQGVIAEYSHSLAVEAIKDFYEGFPVGKKDYQDELRQFILNLYSKKSDKKCLYFIDKTPRYHIISDEIIKLFPEGKFIFLWRNPLAIVSSIINSWTKGRWKISYYNIDLYNGINQLLRTYSSYKSQVHSVQYEKLVQNPTAEVRKICDYLQLDYSDKMIDGFKNIRLNGRLGDRIGSKKYSSLSDASLNSWKFFFNNPFRRYWAKKYLNWIGEENLKILGYDYFELREAVLNERSLNMRTMLFDLLMELYLSSKAITSPLRAKGRDRNLFYYF